MNKKDKKVFLNDPNVRGFIDWLNLMQSTHSFAS